MLRKLLPKRFRKDYPLVAVLRLTGTIGMPSRFQSSLSISNCAEPIERAFSLRGVRAVALVVNSPGGSAVQSRLIYKRIRDFAEEKSVPVYTFCEDAAASGGYMLACAGEEIYADPSSIVGSIGVISAGFGFTGAIDKLGVERRIHTAGDNKSILDPFVREREEDVEHLKKLQLEIHETFKSLVREARGDRLKGEDKDMFSGLFWTGEVARDLGLVDGIGDIRSVMRDKFGDNVQLRVMAPEKSWLKRRLGLSKLALEGFEPGALTSGLADDLLGAAETRALWSRLGL